jgi:hypothetical protein
MMARGPEPQLPTGTEHTNARSRLLAVAVAVTQLLTASVSVRTPVPTQTNVRTMPLQRVPVLVAVAALLSLQVPISVPVAAAQADVPVPELPPASWRPGGWLVSPQATTKGPRSRLANQRGAPNPNTEGVLPTSKEWSKSATGRVRRLG